MKAIGKFFKNILLFLLIIILIAAISFFGAAYFKKEQLYKKASISEKVNQIESMPTYIKTKNVSPNFLEAMVCIEDHRFYKHSGFDIISFSRAFITNLKTKEFTQGGSTITQQLAKKMYLTSEKNIFRKLTELLIAKDLEKYLNKEKILELYINSIFYGNNSTGIYNASLNYFGKTPNNLTDEEAAFLAGLPQAPSIYSRDSNLANERKQEVVDAVAKFKDKIK